MRRSYMFTLGLLLTMAGVFFGRAAHAEIVNVFDYLAGFSAKETCSCAFVVGQSEEYCQAFGKTGTYKVDIKIDRSGQSVTSSFMGSSATAHALEGGGCTLDEPKPEITK